MSYHDIPGYSGFLPVYDQAVEEARDGDTFVEVGVALGHSIAYLARKVIDSKKDIAIYAVDPWLGDARNGEQQTMADNAGGDFRLFINQMTRHAPEELERVRVVRATSRMASAMFDDATLALVLIDGAHDFDSVCSDIQDWRRKLQIGGILAGDDHEPNYPGVEEACRKFWTNYEVRGTAWVKRL